MGLTYHIMWSNIGVLKFKVGIHMGIILDHHRRAALRVIERAGLDKVANTLKLESDKHTQKQIEGLSYQPNRIENLLYNRSICGVTFDVHMYIYDIINDHIKSGAMGKPVVHMKEYESNPGVWILKDSENPDFMIIIYTDVHRKNAFKGTSIEVIGSSDEIEVYGKLLAFVNSL